MVEFALAFPIFLMVVLGIFEFGRLFFIYTSIYTAAREGARYGAAVENQNDCGAGIEAQAKRVGLLAGDMTVVYFYDKGPGTSTFACSGNGFNLENGDRVLVRTSVVYKSVTGIVPTFTIESTARRSIIKEAHLEWKLLPPGTTATPYPTRPPAPTDEPVDPPLPEPLPDTTPTVTPTPLAINQCNGTMQVVEQPESSIVVVTIANGYDYVLPLDYVKVSWAANDRYLSMISYESPALGSRILWTGYGSASPFYLSFSPPKDLYPGVTTFYFYFTKNNVNITNVEMNFQSSEGERCYINNSMTP